jgi:hypothetical protein
MRSWSKHTDQTQRKMLQKRKGPENQTGKAKTEGTEKSTEKRKEENQVGENGT